MKNGKRLWILSLGVLLAGSAAFAQERMSITALNAKIKSAKGNWTAGATSVSELSDDEFQSRLLSPEDIAASAKMAKSLRKIQAAIARLQPLVADHVAKMDAMPMNNDADAQAKMIANYKGMKAIGVAYKTGR